MIARDISNIVLGDCNTITDDSTIHVFTNSSTTDDTYKLIGNKYYQSASDAFVAIPPDLKCYTSTEMSQLPSNYDWVDPFYHILAGASIVLIVFLAFRLIIYPFYRKR